MGPARPRAAFLRGATGKVASGCPCRTCLCRHKLALSRGAKKEQVGSPELIPQVVWYLIADARQGADQEIPRKKYENFLCKVQGDENCMARAKACFFGGSSTLALWYHGDMERKEAEQLLKDGRKGTYLVRNRSSNANNLAVSYYDGADAKRPFQHVLLHLTKDPNWFEEAKQWASKKATADYKGTEHNCWIAVGRKGQKAWWTGMEALCDSWKGLSRREPAVCTFKPVPEEIAKKAAHWPLCTAAKAGDNATAESLPDAGMNIEEAGCTFKTVPKEVAEKGALCKAAKAGDDAKVESLLDAGANIQEYLSEYFPEYGVYPDVNRRYGHTAGGGYRDVNALHLAAEGGHDSTVLLLLARDANIEAGTVSDYGEFGDPGETALELAEGRGHHSTVEILKQAAQFNRLKPLICMLTCVEHCSYPSSPADAQRILAYVMPDKQACYDYGDFGAWVG